MTVATELRSLVDEYRTCEFATLTRAGLPIAWPTAPLVDAVTGEITITTSIGLARKALNVRRDPRVGLLFSDPTGSGRDDLPQVLVRGTAVCPEEIRTSPAELEEYWSRLKHRQPASRANTANAFSRWLMDWYYMRLVITVTPTDIEVLPPWSEPAPAPAGEPRPQDTRPAALLARRLPDFRSGVLAWSSADGTPMLRRVGLRPEASGDRFGLHQAGDGLPSSGRASVLLHSHDEHLWNLRLCAAVGALEPGPDGVEFVPERFIPGPGEGGGPLALVNTVRELRGATRRYLDARALPRPRIDWKGFAELP